jgi:hypothetical protein
LTVLFFFIELALYFPFNIFCDGCFLMGEENQPANPKREEAWNQCWPITAFFFFHNWLSGFFFGTTHGININYFKKKN